MIEQQNNLLLISFPSPEAARAFHLFLQSLLASSAPPFDPSPVSPQVSPEPGRSRHVLLTPEREEQIFNQRQSHQTASQRILRAQVTLRDGVLPFSKPGQTPQPSGQPSPRQKAQQEGTFADGEGRPAAGKSRLRPSSPQPSKS